MSKGFRELGFQSVTALETPQVKNKVDKTNLGSSRELLGYGWSSKLYGGLGPRSSMSCGSRDLHSKGGILATTLPEQFSLKCPPDRFLMTQLRPLIKESFGSKTRSLGLEDAGRLSFRNFLSLDMTNFTLNPLNQTPPDFLAILGEDSNRTIHLLIYDNSLRHYLCRVDFSYLTGEYPLAVHDVSITKDNLENVTSLEFTLITNKAAKTYSVTGTYSDYIKLTASEETASVDFGSILEDTNIHRASIDLASNSSLPATPDLVLTHKRLRKIYRLNYNSGYVLAQEIDYKPLSYSDSVRNSFTSVMDLGSGDEVRLCLVTSNNTVHDFSSNDLSLQDVDANSSTRIQSQVSLCNFNPFTSSEPSTNAGYVISLRDLENPIPILHSFPEDTIDYRLDVDNLNSGGLSGQDGWSLIGSPLSNSSTPTVELSVTDSYQEQTIRFRNEQGVKRSITLDKSRLSVLLRLRCSELGNDTSGLRVGIFGPDSSSNNVFSYITLCTAGRAVTAGGTYTQEVPTEVGVYDWLITYDHANGFKVKDPWDTAGKEVYLTPDKELSGTFPDKGTELLLVCDSPDETFYLEYLRLLPEGLIHTLEQDYIASSLYDSTYTGRTYVDTKLDSYTHLGSREYHLADNLYRHLGEYTREVDVLKSTQVTGESKVGKRGFYREVINRGLTHGSYSDLQLLSRYIGLLLDRSKDDIRRLPLNKSLLRASPTEVLLADIPKEVETTEHTQFLYGNLLQILWTSIRAKRGRVESWKECAALLGLIRDDKRVVRLESTYIIAGPPVSDIQLGRDTLDSGIPFDSAWFDSVSAMFEVVAGIRMYEFVQGEPLKYIPAPDPIVEELFSYLRYLAPLNTRIQYSSGRTNLFSSAFSELPTGNFSSSSSAVSLPPSSQEVQVKRDSDKVIPYIGDSYLDLTLDSLGKRGFRINNSSGTGKYALSIRIQQDPSNESNPTLGEGLAIDLVGDSGIPYSMRLERNALRYNYSSNPNSTIDLTKVEEAHSLESYFQLGLYIDQDNETIDVWLGDSLWYRSVPFASSDTFKHLDIYATGTSGQNWKIGMLLLERL